MGRTTSALAQRMIELDEHEIQRPRSAELSRSVAVMHRTSVPGPTSTHPGRHEGTTSRLGRHHDHGLTVALAV